MTDKRTWFITGAGRGMGVEFARAALAAGNNVVASGVSFRLRESLDAPPRKAPNAADESRT